MPTFPLMRNPVIFLIIASLLVLTNSNRVKADGGVYSELGDGGMVVSDSAIASRIGRDILKRGGNAVDAAIATAFALAVTWPEAGNIGGGGFMMIRPADGNNPVCVDYRETAPALTQQNSFTLGESRHKPKAAGVPGTVRGLELAHKKYGKLPWKDLVQPAALLAKRGFFVDSFLAESANKVLHATKNEPKFSELHRVYGKQDRSDWNIGDSMYLPELAKTLTAIAEHGADAFYTGEISKLIVKETFKGDGLIRASDLASYEAKIRKPIIGSFKEYQVIGPPPPSSGGIAIVQALNMVEAIDLPKNKYDSKTIHLLAEISRRFFLDRARYLGDQDFISIPEHLTSKEYARKLVSDIDLNKASISSELAPDIELADESEDTTHFSVIDAHGMAVSNTYTIEASWGSRIVVPGAGFLLNNEMGDFNWVRGHTDRKGRIGTKPNLIKPGKRMLSSQCPVIVTKNNKLLFVTGSPGGRTILNTVLNIVLNTIHFDMPFPLAVESKRYHHQWMPDLLYLEDVPNPPFSHLKSELEKKGHTIINRPTQGSAHSIWRDPNSNNLIGVADYRRGGRPASISTSRLARWDFDGTKGSTLNSEISNGKFEIQWSTGISGGSYDGNDNFVINQSGPGITNQAHVKLPIKVSQLNARITLNGINFVGPEKNERIEFALTSNALSKTPTIASFSVARNDQNQIVLFSDSGGTKKPKTQQTILSHSPHLSKPLAIKLSVDTKNQIYQVALRRNTDTEFTIKFSGKINSALPLDYAQFTIFNDFASPGEFFKIDSIELSLPH